MHQSANHETTAAPTSKLHGIRCHDCGVPVDTAFTVEELDALNLEMLSKYKLAERKARQVRRSSKTVQCKATQECLRTLAEAIDAIVRATLLHRDVYHPLPADDVCTLRSPAGWYAD
jgi:hypothetical protein